MRCLRSLGTCHVTFAARGALRTEATALPACASGPPMSEGANGWGKTVHPMLRAAPLASFGRRGAALASWGRAGRGLAPCRQTEASVTARLRLLAP
eukprot:3140049-Pyramimonas_sp.AAC.1